jgi:A/G-specific adenine glycosylase
MKTSQSASGWSALPAWYRRVRRPLPWRETRDPYAIWISEAMLQQTRVQTVEPYWRRFLARFPTVRALAAASESEVLALWSGLGYYRRARALREGARAIVQRHGGRFPRERAELLELPGIGPYTAGALLSIAFDRPEPLVDGNVERVFSRLFGLEAESGSASLRRDTWKLAAELVPARGAGDWNQALMELGATVCTPRNPLCGSCPVARRCVARREDRVGELPRVRARPPATAVELEVLLARRGSRLLLEQRPDRGRMSGLWQLPSIELPGPSGARTGLFPDAWARGGRLLLEEPVGVVRHTITTHRIRARVLRGRPAPGARIREPLAWIEEAALGELPLTGMTRKILRARFAGAG